MAVIGIHYSGGEVIGEENEDNYELTPRTPVIYKHVYLHLSNDKELIFDTGDFVKDWFNAKKKFLDVLEEEVHLSASSSVDHFIMDGAPYDSAYLVFKDENDTGELSYNSEDYDKGWEMFVHKGTTPTWVELKQYCKS